MNKLDRDVFIQYITRFVPTVLAFYNTEEPDVDLIFTPQIREAKYQYPGTRLSVISLSLFEEIMRSCKGKFSIDDILLVGQYRCIGSAKNTDTEKIKNFFQEVHEKAQLYKTLPGRKAQTVNQILNQYRNSASNPSSSQAVTNSVPSTSTNIQNNMIEKRKSQTKLNQIHLTTEYNNQNSTIGVSPISKTINTITEDQKPIFTNPEVSKYSILDDWENKEKTIINQKAEKSLIQGPIIEQATKKKVKAKRKHHLYEEIINDLWVKRKIQKLPTILHKNQPSTMALSDISLPKPPPSYDMAVKTLSNQNFINQKSHSIKLQSRQVNHTFSTTSNTIKGLSGVNSSSEIEICEDTRPIKLGEPYLPTYFEAMFHRYYQGIQKGLENSINQPTYVDKPKCNSRKYKPGKISNKKQNLK